MSDNMNLKNNHDILRYYRRVETGKMEERVRLSPDDVGRLTSTIVPYPEQERVFFTEEEVRNFKLDQYGSNIPYIDGELTILNNYFFDFWGYYLNAEGVALYGHLKRYAYGSKDWCFPNIDLISLKMSKSRPTILNYMELLERYGFIYKFNVLNASREMIEESPIYKIRKQVPLLTDKLINGDVNLEIPNELPPHLKKAYEKEKKGLPERLKIEHEKYVTEKINKNDIFEVEIDDSIDFEAIYSELMKEKERISFKKRDIFVKEAKLVNHIRTEMSTLEKEILDYILEQAKNIVSKPSFDTWFRKLLILKNEKTYRLYTPNPFTQEWLEKKYNNFIRSCIEKIDSDFEHIEYRSII